MPAVLKVVCAGKNRRRLRSWFPLVCCCFVFPTTGVYLTGYWNLLCRCLYTKGCEIVFVHACTLKAASPLEWRIALYLYIKIINNNNNKNYWELRFWVWRESMSMINSVICRWSDVKTVLCMMLMLVERWGPATGCGDYSLVHCGRTQVNLGGNSSREEGPFRCCMGEGGKWSNGW